MSSHFATSHFNLLPSQKCGSNPLLALEILKVQACNWIFDAIKYVLAIIRG